MYFINEHEIVLDKNERLEPWTSYDRVLRLAMDFVKNCPVDPESGLPWYLCYSCFWTDPLRPADWPDNPAGKFAWAVTTLLKYYPYSGDEAHIGIVRAMLDRLIDQRVPDGMAWEKAPYASAHPGKGLYFGARADGEYATEPDKVGQVGRALVDFYEITGEDKYLRAGRDCADILIKNLQSGDALNSPVPFRVDVRDGRVIEAYTSDMITLVRLFDELVRLGMKEYAPARDRVWMWIESYPLKNNVWKGYFEDIRLDVENANCDQMSSLETARWLMAGEFIPAENAPLARGLIEWVKNTLGASPFFGSVPIHEQKFCFFVMGSHTARFAALCARWYELSREEDYRETAVRALNWASYMACENGTVTVGVDRPDYYNQCWFTDGYFDYIPHFIDTMASIPALAPDDSDHMLRSSTAIQKIEYKPGRISYRTFDSLGSQTLKLTFEPYQISGNGEVIPRLERPGDHQSGWFYDPAAHVLSIHHNDPNILIEGRD